MSNSISGKFDNIYKLLSDRSLTILSEIPDHFKCVICNELIIKANQAMCGCNFCEKCIEIYMKNEETICPGNSTECKLDNLSNITTNHGLNKQISKLIVKCPNKICNYECQLIDMSDHLSICTKKIDKCPFNEFGCACNTLEIGQLNDHFQSDMYMHNKILIDMNGNLRNEISELKSDLMKKFEKNEELYEEMNLLEKKNDEMIQLIQINNGKIYSRFLEIFMRNFFGENNDNEIPDCELKNSIKENIQKEFDLEIQEIMNNCDQETSDSSGKPRKFDLEINEKIHKLEWFVDMTYPNNFSFKIPLISGLRNPFYSNQFMFRKYAYNMRLKCENKGTRFYIYLCISPGLYDDSLTWPFKANVTITIFSHIFKAFGICYSNYCVIERSNAQSSFYFLFNHSELLNHRLMHIPCTVKCNIDN